MNKFKYLINFLLLLIPVIYCYAQFPDSTDKNMTSQLPREGMSIKNDSICSLPDSQVIKPVDVEELPDSLKVLVDSTSIVIIDSSKQVVADSSLDSLLVPVENKAFGIGEKLKYALKYEFIKAGSAQFEVKEGMASNGQPCYRIISTAKSTRAFDWIYKVRDRVESLVDKRSLFPWYYKKQLREGRYKFDLEVKYDHLNQEAFVKAIRYHSNMSIRKKEAYSVDIPRYVRDVFGTLYYLRTQPMEVGKPIFVSNHDNRKVYELRIIIEAKEVVKVKAGKFHCIRVQPILEGEAIFKQKGRLWVWFTDDERKIPVKLKSKAIIGAFHADLEKVEGINGNIDARIDGNSD